jgi:hypothetical protein
MLSVVIALACLGLIVTKGLFDPPRPVMAEASKIASSSSFLRVAPDTEFAHPTGKALINPTYPAAPAPGSAHFRTLTFAELKADDTSSTGTKAGHNLLVRTKNGNAAAAEALYNGSTKRGFDEYQRAVFLNTVANIYERDPILLENTVFVGFYDGHKSHKLEYGIILSGITTEKLYIAKMGPAGLLGLMGRRSPKSDKIASLEATQIRGISNTYAFDVDLYNPKSEPEKHAAETYFNDTTPAATHPADVARALRLRGIASGVSTR